MTDADLARRVKAGAAFLDERFPGWRRSIDKEELYLGSPERCILGQLGNAGVIPVPKPDTEYSGYSTTYDRAIAELELEQGLRDVDLAFDKAGYEEDYGDMTDAWVLELEGRLLTEKPEAAQVSYWLAEAGKLYAAQDVEATVAKLEAVLRSIR